MQDDLALGFGRLCLDRGRTDAADDGPAPSADAVDNELDESTNAGRKNDRICNALIPFVRKIDIKET